MVYLIIIAIIIFLIASGVKIVSQSKAIVIERLGSYYRTMSTGINYKRGCKRKVYFNLWLEEAWFWKELDLYSERKKKNWIWRKYRTC